MSHFCISQNKNVRFNFNGKRLIRGYNKRQICFLRASVKGIMPKTQFFHENNKYLFKVDKSNVILFAIEMYL